MMIGMDTDMELDKSLFKQFAKEMRSKNLTTDKDLSKIMQQMMKHVIEAMLDEEMQDHLGYPKYAPEGRGSGNSRNGSSKKTVRTEQSQLEVDIPRDRNASFEPKIVPKGQSRTGIMDDQIIALYAKGMSTREIGSMIKELYDVDISPSLISQVTDRVLDEVVQWQSRPLDALYPIVYLDCIVLKIKEGQQVKNKAIYIALGINAEGHKELLGLWLSENEGSRFWLGVLTELKNRGVEDILIACVDGLKGLPEAIQSVYPQTQVQLCIVHMVRNSLKFVSWKDYKKVTAELKQVYQAVTQEQALFALEQFEQHWPQYPQIVKLWQRHWENVMTLFAYPDYIRKTIYTTNAIESLNSVIRSATKRHKLFPSDEAALKVVYLAIMQASKKWTMPIRDWRSALNQFSIMFGERVTDRI
jgi:transposase-like protein